MTKVGIIVTSLYDSNQQKFIDGFRAQSDKNSIISYVFVGNNPHDYEIQGKKDNSLLSTIVHSDLDIVVMLSATIIALTGIELIERFIEGLFDIPVISVGVNIPNTYSIDSDNYESVKEMMGHLIVDHGFKRVAFVKGPEENREANDRFNGYKDSLLENSIPFNYKLVAPGSFSPGDGRKALSLLLDIRKESLDAIFCCHDLCAIEVINNLALRGFDVPNDIAVVGFDNIDVCSSLTPALSTINLPFFNSGLLAGEYVVKIIENRAIPNHFRNKTHVILRESCGCKKGVIDRSIPNENISLDDIMDRTFDTIIKKHWFNVDIYDSFIKESLKELNRNFIISNRQRSEEPFLSFFRTLLNRTLQIKLDIIIWKEIVDDYKNMVYLLDVDLNKELFASYLIDKALVIIYETEKSIYYIDTVETREIIQNTNKIGNILLTCKSDLELKQILKNNLSNLKIDNFFIVLFTDRKEIGELYFSRNMEKLFDNGESFKFNLKTLIPDNLGKASLLSYIVYSIKVNEVEWGYILIENGNTPNIIYSFISEKVSYGFKNISLIKKMNSYTKELEEAVNSRTMELRLANNQLKERSMKDQLTGLYNRRFLEEVVIPKSEVVKDGKSREYGIILVDLDNFKMVNDVYGHTSGDSVIKELAKTLSYLVRPEDYVIRLGGEEFLIVLRNFKGEFLQKVAQNILKSVKETKYKMENGDEINKTCSLGAIVFNSKYNNLINIKSSISIIDKCLYQSKNSGRDKGFIVEVSYEQFIGCSDLGLYITNNFEKCINSNKIKLIECN